MNSIELYYAIIDSIAGSVSDTSNEPDIVRKSIEAINNINHPGNIKIQTGFCHQKPYAIFVDPDNLYGKKRTELGDYLFVAKVISNRLTTDKRALFFQAKLDKSFSNFTIEKHQQRFYSQIDIIKFTFGNNIYNASNIEPIIWENISTPEHFGDYLLLGNSKAIDISLESINMQYNPDGHSYTFYLSPNHYYSGYPLLNFLKPYGKGTKIAGTFEIFIDLIYKKLNLKNDPPDEHEGFWDDDPKGFGIVEITYFEE